MNKTVSLFLFSLIFLSSSLLLGQEGAWYESTEFNRVTKYDPHPDMHYFADFKMNTGAAWSYSVSPETTHLTLFAYDWGNKVDYDPLSQAPDLKYLRLSKKVAYGYQFPTTALGAGSAPNLFRLPEISSLEVLVLSQAEILNPQDSSYSSQDFWNKIASYPNMRTLNLFGNPHLDLYGIEVLENTPQLNELILMGCDLDDLSPLTKLSSIEYLDLSPVSGTDLNPLEELSSLKALRLSQDDNPDLSPLTFLPDLQLLELNGVHGLSGLGASESLRALRLGYSARVNDQSLEEILCLKNLEYLTFVKRVPLQDLFPIFNSQNQQNLKQIQVGSLKKHFFSFDQRMGERNRHVVADWLNSAEDLELLVEIPGVYRLNIGNEVMDQDISGIDFTILSLIPELEELDFSYLTFDEWQIEQLNNMSLDTLHELDLTSVKSRGIAFDRLVPNVKVLRLAQSNISGGDVKKIAKLQYLRELDLSATSVTYTVVDHLAKFSSPIQELDLSRNNLKGTNFRLLASLGQLKKLNLRGCQMYKNDLLTLKELGNLEILDLQDLPNGNITDKEMDELRVALPNCRVII